MYLSLFASLSQLFLILVTHDVVMCFYPFQAPMPSLVLFMPVLLCLCQSCSVSFHIVYHSPSQSPFVSCLHSQCSCSSSCRIFYLHVFLLQPAGQELKNNQFYEDVLFLQSRHNLIMSCSAVWDLAFSVVYTGILVL